MSRGSKETPVGHDRQRPTEPTGFWRDANVTEVDVTGATLAPEIAEVCAPAVDSLEIAARLEAAGISDQVVIDTYDMPDVFALADEIYRRTRFQSEPGPPPAIVAGGSWRDLARGALFALPTLFFTAGSRALGLRPVWWALPAGLVVGWGLAQLVASMAWTMRGTRDEAGEPVLIVCAIVIGVVVPGAVATAATHLLGGGLSAVLVAMAIALYMVESGILLFYGDERWLAFALVPGAAAAALRVVDPSWPPIERGTAAAILATVALTSLFVLRHVPGRGWNRPKLGRSAVTKGAQFFAHGLSCGLLTCLLIGFETRPGHGNLDVSLAVWPLLLTLGLMEWQLRSLRMRVTARLEQTHVVRDFEADSRRALIRCMATYASLLVTLSLGAGLIGAARHTTLALPLVAQGTLGLAFFVALILVASGRVDLVLRAWLASLAVCAGCLRLAQLRGHRLTTADGVAACAVTAVVAFVMLFAYALRVVGSAFNY
jgi:hypothetical protein